jgi:hypothetical protein
MSSKKNRRVRILSHWAVYLSSNTTLELVSDLSGKDDAAKYSVEWRKLSSEQKNEYSKRRNAIVDEKNVSMSKDD